MQRRVWSIEEIVNILRAVAMQGGDRNTIAVIAVALGIYAEYKEQMGTGIAARIDALEEAR